MKRPWLLLLYAAGIACLAIALSYPIRYMLEAKSVDDGTDRLRQMKMLGEQAQSDGSANATNAIVSGSEQGAATLAPDAPIAPIASVAPDATGMPSPSTSPAFTQTPVGDGREGVRTTAEATSDAKTSASPDTSQAVEASPDTAAAASGNAASDIPSTGEPEGEGEAVDRRLRTKQAQPYPMKEKSSLDAEKILPQYREIYAQNSDFVGWLYIEGTIIDYPVMQSEDHEYYLKRNFFGETNANGQLILDSKCDPYTPSYNLIISGHNMNSGKMFGRLTNYNGKSYWQKHKYVVFDTLMEENVYVVVAAFYSADYDENEEGFRYNADIQYAAEFDEWKSAIEEIKLYETGIEMEFGDEFLTLTTCSYQRRDGRFVVITRKLRDGEEIE